jgi:ABC-type bacteriocin/lantibiotic exporter with double-glycine peptidase domain
MQLLALAVPEFTQVVMNRALPDGALSTLQLVATGAVLVALFLAVSGWIRQRTLLYVTTQIEVSVLRGFLDHLLRLPYVLLRSKTLGELLQTFSGLASAREEFAERALATILDGTMATAFVVAMGVKLPWMTAVILTAVLFMVGLAVLVGRGQARHQALEVKAQARQRGYLAELIAGAATIKAAGAERTGLRRWGNHFALEIGITLNRQRLGLWTEVGLELTRQALGAGLLIWGGSLVLRGELSLGTLFAFVQLSAGFMTAVMGLVGSYLALVVLRPQLSKAEELLAAKTEGWPRPPGATKAHPVRMEDVWYRYGPQQPWVLRGFNLEVPAGGQHTITGPSGAGKTTILRLLAGLDVPERGSVTIGGREPREVRNDLLYLPQFVQLYGGSILDNLRVLSGNAPLPDLQLAAQATGLHAFIETLPMGYGTVLPHGARSLSGGQRQLIAVTAALASHRALLLLDEAMANIDAVAAVLLQTLLAQEQSTVVRVSHEGGRNPGRATQANANPGLDSAKTSIAL